MTRTMRFMALALAAGFVLGCGGVVKAEQDSATDAMEDTPEADTTADGVTDPGDDTAEDPSPDIVADLGPDSPCPPVQIPFEAEDMVLDEGFATGESSREYIGTFIESRTDGYGSASMALEIPCSDTYVLWGLVWWESTRSDSFYWDWDGGTDYWVWDLMQQCDSSPVGVDWYWDQVSLRHESSPPGMCGPTEEDPALMELTEGSHTFTLGGRESMSAVAEFVLTNDLDYVPPDPG